jgi:Arc/MetJ-type ribon-helix-helix transcriptional regulator
MNKMNKTKRIVFTASENFEKKLEELLLDSGFNSRSEVIRVAVDALHIKRFPRYGNTGGSSIPLTAEQKVLRDQEEKKAKEDLFIERQKAICQLLEGEVVEKDGNISCRYYNYAFKKRYLQETPIRMLSNDMVKNQYSPSKEKVQKFQEEKQTDY